MSGVALAMVLLSALLHAAWNAAAKGSANPAAFILGFDALAMLVLLPLLLLCDLRQVPGEVWWLIVASGVVHGVYGFWLTRAYEAGDLNLVYPIARSTPAFVPLLAMPLLGERLSPLGGVGIVIVVVSLWLIHINRQTPILKQLLRPESTFAYLTLASTVGYSLTDGAAMDRLTEVAWSGPAPRALVFLVLIQMVYLPIFALLAADRVHPSRLLEVWREQRWRLPAASAGAFLSYSLVLEAMRHARVSYVVAVRQASVVFALLLGVVWLRERPTPARVLGILGTVAGIGLIALYG